jgi:sodium--glutamate symport carrier gltS
MDDWNRAGMTISDNVISFDALPSLLAACLVLLLGTLLSQRIALLARYSIPSPVIGGIVFAIAAAVLVRTTGQGIAMANAAKSALLLVFFASLGLTSNLRRLLRGGPRLLRFLAALVPFLMVQGLLSASGRGQDLPEVQGRLAAAAATGRHGSLPARLHAAGAANPADRSARFAELGRSPAGSVISTLHAG